MERGRKGETKRQEEGSIDGQRERYRRDEMREGEKEDGKGADRWQEGDREEGASSGQQGRVGNKHGNEQRSVCSLRVGKREDKQSRMWTTC